MIDGRYLQWWSSVAFNRSDFYESSATKRSRKGFAARAATSTSSSTTTR